MALIYGDQTKWASFSDEEREAAYALYREFGREAGGGEALAHGSRRERPVALEPREVHAPAQVEEHEAERDVDEEAGLVEKRPDVQGARQGRDAAAIQAAPASRTAG